MQGINVLSASALIGAMALSGNAWADFMGDLTPYVGLDAKFARIKGDEKVREDLPSTYWGFNPNVGARYCNVALEVGYDWFDKETKNNLKSDIQGFHVDLNGYYPMEDTSLELIGSVGVGFLQAKLTGTSTNSQITNLMANDKKSDTDATLRLGVGAQYQLSDMVGIRGMVRYANTSQINFNLPAGSTLDKHLYRDSFSGDLGIFVKLG